jgi:hypothetical protein
MPTTCPFGYSGTKKKKKHLTNLEIHSWSKNTKKKKKILPLFVIKGQRVNKVIEKSHWYLKKYTKSRKRKNCSQNNNQEQIRE